VRDSQADQAAAARREASRRHATLDTGEEAAIRTYTVEVTTDEAEAIRRGVMPPGVQAQIERISAEDAVIDSMEENQ
jgi:hypothetical protein